MKLMNRLLHTRTKRNKAKNINAQSFFFFFFLSSIGILLELFFFFFITIYISQGNIFTSTPSSYQIKEIHDKFKEGMGNFFQLLFHLFPNHHSLVLSLIFNLNLFFFSRGGRVGI